MAKPIHTPKQNPPGLPKGSATARMAQQAARLYAYPADSLLDDRIKPAPLRPGHYAHNHKTMDEWSFAAKLTVFQMPIDGVAWTPEVERTPGINHYTPNLAMRVVFVKDDMFIAFGTGPDAPTHMTMRIPRNALLTLLAKSASMDMQVQEKRTYYLSDSGELLDTTPIPVSDDES